MRCKKIWCLSLFIFETSESLSVGPKPNVEITSLAKLQKNTKIFDNQGRYISR